MRSAAKFQYPVNLKLIIISLFFLFFLFLFLQSSFQWQQPQQPPSSTSSESHISAAPHLRCPQERFDSCRKIAPSLSQARIHYATSNITPQQTLPEISVTERVLRRRSPCNFLVFGLGYDSLMWAALNHGGRTLFLEEDESWIQQIKAKFPSLDSRHVEYDTKVTQSEELLRAAAAAEECKEVVDPRESKCRLALKGRLPREVYEVQWDLIMVDAPTGWHDKALGRMTAVYTARMIARYRESGETDAFVHDVDRTIEYKFSRFFLCEGYMTEQQGRLRHFTIPSHRSRPGRPFCPPTSGGIDADESP